MPKIMQRAEAGILKREEKHLRAFLLNTILKQIRNKQEKRELAKALKEIGWNKEMEREDRNWNMFLDNREFERECRLNDLRKGFRELRKDPRVPKLIQIGDSVGFVIGKHLLESMGWEKGDFVDVKLCAGILHVKNPTAEERESRGKPQDTIS